MNNEKELSQEYLDYFRALKRTIEKTFTKRRISTYFCENIADCRKQIYQIIQRVRPKDGVAKIGFADSVTLHQIDLFEIIGELDHVEILNPFERCPDGKYKVFGDLPEGKLNLPEEIYEEKVESLLSLMRKTLLSDIFITGANAITLDGKIVATDGTGNRVAGMCFGPKKLIIIAGRNKIVRNLDEANYRIRNIAAPLNGMRHLNKHHNRFENLPCVRLGYCVDCSHPSRMCNMTVIIESAAKAFQDRIHLVLVNGDLGF